MNRRLFTGKLAAGVSLLGVPSSLLAHSVAAPSGPLGTAVSLQQAAGWIQRDALGALEQIYIWHVYSPGHTSAAALKALLQEELATISELLGLKKPLVAPELPGLSASEFGTYWVCLDQDGISVSWQGLARIGSQAANPVGSLSLLGSKGLVQSNPTGKGYALIDLQTQHIQQVVNGSSRRVNRRNFFTL